MINQQVEELTKTKISLNIFTHTSTLLATALIFILALNFAYLAFVSLTTVNETTQLMTFSIFPQDIRLNEQTVLNLGQEEKRMAIELNEALPDYQQYGAPALPYLRYTILLPAGKTVKSIQAKPIERRAQFLNKDMKLTYIPQPFDGYDMTKPEEAERWEKENHEDKDLFNTHAFYPREIASYTVRRLRGYQIADILITPVQYNPVTGQLLVSNHLEYSLELQDDTASLSKSYGLRNKQEDISFVQKMAVNPTIKASYNKYQPLAFEELAGEHYYYVIITTNDFANDPNLINFKNVRSPDPEHQAKIVTLDDINAIYTDPAMEQWQKIELYIQNNLYPAPPEGYGTDYILIVGDVQFVPANSNLYYTAYSDLKYSDGQIPVGRFPVDTSDDLLNIINKNLSPINHETEKVQTLWWSDDVIAHDFPFVKPYLSVDITDLKTCHDACFSDMLNTHSIVSALGHGDYFSWIDYLNNSAIRPVGINLGCEGAKFAYSDARSEIHATHPNGHTAIIASTNVTEKGSPFDHYIYSNYFTEGIIEPRLGDMLLLAWPYDNRQGMTLLGDPLYEMVSEEFKNKPRLTPYITYGWNTRSYNLEQGNGEIDEVITHVNSFNSCGWEVANITYSDPVLANHIQVLPLSGNQSSDIHTAFSDPDTIPAGNYTIEYDVRDTTNNYIIQHHKINLWVTNHNILSDDDFEIDGDDIILPADEYVMGQDLTVESGKNLIIQPGVVLKNMSEFGGEWKIVINEGATIRAIGTSSQPINFLTANGMDGGIKIEIHQTDGLLSGEFAYAVFNQQIAGINQPQVTFDHCDFFLGFFAEDFFLFPSLLKGTMKNSLISTGGMGAVSEIGDLSGLNINYSNIGKTQGQFFGGNEPPVYYHEGEGVINGNEYINMTDSRTLTVMSSCINAGDPESPLDPDGTRADIGAYYHDLSNALKVPQDYSTIQQALNAAGQSGGGAIIVGSGTYNEALTIPASSPDYGAGIRLMGASGENRPILLKENHTGKLISANADNTNLFLENFVLQNIGINKLGNTLYLGAYDMKIMLKNCEFSQNTNNSDVINISLSASFGSPVVYFEEVKFSDNHNNNRLISVYTGSSSWNTFTKCQFTDNSADQLIYFELREDYKHWLFDNVVFKNNTATNLINYINSNFYSTYDNNIHFRQSLFIGNQGHIISDLRSHLVLENNTFHHNVTDIKSISFSRLKLQNSIFWQNTGSLKQENMSDFQINYSDIDVELPNAGIGNIFINPYFVDPENEDFRIKWSSPAKNIGDPACLLDPDGTRADMGAFFHSDQGTISSATPLQINQDQKTYFTIYGDNLDANTPVALLDPITGKTDSQIATSTLNQEIKNVEGKIIGIRSLVEVKNTAKLGYRTLALGYYKDLRKNNAVKIVPPASPKPSPAAIIR